MNEYAITVEMTSWGLFWPKRYVDTFVVASESAAEAEQIVRSGLVPGMRRYQTQALEEDEFELDPFSNLVIIDIVKL